MRLTDATSLDLSHPRNPRINTGQRFLGPGQLVSLEIHSEQPEFFGEAELPFEIIQQRPIKKPRTRLKVYGPVLNASSNPSGLLLQWKYNFVLQSATNVGGPYSDVSGVPNPCTNPFATGPQKFFRLRQ